MHTCEPVQWLSVDTIRLSFVATWELISDSSQLKILPTLSMMSSLFNSDFEIISNVVYQINVLIWLTYKQYYVYLHIHFYGKAFLINSMYFICLNGIISIAKYGRGWRSGTKHIHQTVQALCYLWFVEHTTSNVYVVSQTPWTAHLMVPFPC